MAPKWNIDLGETQRLQADKSLSNYATGKRISTQMRSLETMTFKKIDDAPFQFANLGDIQLLQLGIDQSYRSRLPGLSSARESECEVNEVLGAIQLIHLDFYKPAVAKVGEGQLTERIL